MRSPIILTVLLPPLLILSSAGSSFAQTSGGALRESQPGRVVAADNQGGRLAESSLMAQARYLAISTAEEASKWGDRPAAVRVLSEVADLLWDDDPDRSRAWLTQAWELTDGINDGADDKENRRYRGNAPKGRARAAILSVAQRHDKALTTDFLDKLAKETELTDNESKRGVFDDRTARSEQLLNLALAIVENDPDAAASLAEQSLVDGISFQLQRVLLALRERKRSAADRVFDLSLIRLADGFRDPSEAQVIASYLFTPGRVFSVGNRNTIVLAVNAQTFRVAETPAEADPVRARRFLTVMQHILLSLPDPSATANPSLHAQKMVTLAGSLEHGFKLYTADLWLPIQQRLTTTVSHYLSTPIPDGGLPQTVRERMRSSNAAGVSAGELNDLHVTELEGKADKETNPIARKFAYLQAALATAPEDLTRGLCLAAKINEDALRKQINSFLKYRAALVALENGQTDKALVLAEGTEPLQCAVLLITAAQRIREGGAGESDEHNIGTRIRALELLSDAEKVLKANKRSDAVLRLRLGIATALASLDTIRALDSLNAVVAEINKTDSFDPTDSSPPRVTGSYGFSVQSSLPRIKVGYGLKDALVPLARANLGESIQVAGRLNATTIRGLCMLEIARSILAGGRTTR